MIQKAFYVKRTIMKFVFIEEIEMLPQHIPTIEGKDAEKFMSQDKKRLTTAEKKHLEKCRAIYKKNPIK
jgi:hypothetical protein